MYVAGTGCNAAYVEQIKQIPKWTEEDEGDIKCASTEVKYPNEYLHIRNRMRPR